MFTCPEDAVYEIDELLGASGLVNGVPEIPFDAGPVPELAIALIFGV